MLFGKLFFAVFTDVYLQDGDAPVFFAHVVDDSRQINRDKSNCRRKGKRSNEPHHETDDS